MPPETLAGYLAHTAEHAPPEDRLTFIDRREQETAYHWSVIYARARRAAGALAAQGVRPGDRVAIILPTGVSVMDALFGCQLLGAVPVPLYPPVRLGRLDEYYDRTAHMLRAVEARALITERRIQRLLGQVFVRYAPPLGTLDADALHTGPDRAPTDSGPDGLAMVQFSSGTTVAPKPVGLTHRQVLANTLAILDFIPLEQGFKQSGCTWLPLYHDMGLIGCVFVAVVGPGPLALIPPEVFLTRPALWLRAISRHKATVSPAPNFAYALCAERIQDDELAGCDLSSWRLALNGAEPVAPAALRTFRERFARWGLRPEALTPVYGLAEAALAVTFSDPTAPFQARRLSRLALAHGEARPAAPEEEALEVVSVGTPLRGFGIEIRDDQGSPIGEGRVGRIWAQGPSVMQGYLDRAEQPITEGWLDTGDLGFLLDGELFIAGRAKDIIILRGKNHAPQDIEQAVDDVDGVRVGCAIAVGELSSDGERLLVFVEYRDDPRPSLAADCERAILARTGLKADLVLLVPPGTLPRTSSGKLRRAEALRQYQQGTLAPPDKVTPWLIAGARARSAWGYIQSRGKKD